MKRLPPALLIAGTHSGCGKTTITLAVMAALVRRGYRVQPYKCGPDFIDPGFHTMVTGQTSRNLDLRMCGSQFVCQSFHRNFEGSDCAVVEGVMGLFDGGEGSAASLAKTLNLPVFLVIDVRSAAESIAAVVKGFATLDPELALTGVICNRVGSAKHRAMIADAIAQHCEVPVVGWVPRQEEIHIPSRHLGLHMAEEFPHKDRLTQQLADLAESSLDLDRMLQQARKHPIAALETIPQLPSRTEDTVRIGVARDSAFCFYYEDNLDLLRAAGAELIFFSPLRDAVLPEGLCGLYLGGGYPELYAASLAANQTMLAGIHQAAEQGVPIHAECGGFMYLCTSLTDMDGKCFPMAGIFPFAASMQKKLSSLGYRQVVLEADTILGQRGDTLHGHEFHYSTISSPDISFPTCYRLTDGRAEGYSHNNVLGGYIHLHWGKTPEAARYFVEACRNHSLSQTP